jgi:hypothetical protein
MTHEQEQWNRALRGGRRRKLPFVLALVTGLVVTGATFGGFIAVAEWRQARADAGEVIYEERDEQTLLAMLGIPVLLGVFAFVAVFKLAGGKLAPEYDRMFTGGFQ